MLQSLAFIFRCFSFRDFFVTVRLTLTPLLQEKESKHPWTLRRMEPGVPHLSPSCSGFTQVELISTLVIAAIVAAVALPRFFGRSVFESKGFSDQVLATLRYGQKVAIAQRRFVCAAFASNSVTLTTGPTTACGTALVTPTGELTYSINAPAGVSFAAVPISFNFDALGRASVAQVISVTDAVNNIVVERETGYVHSP